LRHVFISYVHQNHDPVDHLANALRKTGVPVWLDRDDIEPGTRWRIAIKKAIQSGDFFIACFSREYNDRDRTHMSEEITIAIDELRIRPTERTWFIPVLINETRIPSRPISSVEDLSDINAVKLYEDWDIGLKRILRVLTCDDLMRVRIWRLIDMCESPFEGDRLHAIRELAELGVAAKPALFLLIEAAKENNSEIRKLSVGALGKIGAEAAEIVSTLIAALSDPEPDVQMHAADAIGGIGPEAAEAVPALIAALADPKPDLRRRVLHAIGQIAQTGQAITEAVPALIAALTDLDHLVRMAAINSLMRIGPEAVEAAAATLIAALDDPDSHVRILVPCALGFIRSDAVAVPVLSPALDHPDTDVRETAASLLAERHKRASRVA
jgi:hypothetical protein